MKGRNKDLVLMKRKALALTLILAMLFSAAAGTQLVNLGTANPYLWVKEGEVPPPHDAQYPIILILSPKNTSYASNDISFTYNVSLPEIYPQWIKIYYKASWKPNNTYYDYGSTINLTDIPEGAHYLEVTAICEYVIQKHQENITISYVTTKTASSSKVYFTIDLLPKISILSLENNTYSTSNVTLDFNVNEPISEVTYSLDGKENVTIIGNTTLTGLSNGVHNMTVYARDVAGNAGASETIHFNVEVPEPFPTTLVIASIASAATVGIALLVFFKKHKH